MADIVTCNDCDADFEETTIAKISYIKHRYWLCDDCYRLRKEERW